jgi:3-oxoacyl-[acyl-carrier protein] reductase
MRGYTNSVRCQPSTRITLIGVKILVNSILQGATETEGFAAMAGSAEMKPNAISQTPLGRIGAPRDIANVVAFLASDDAAWIPGQMIPVSGGFR